MTDRELLEMAAKAVGIKTSAWHEIEHPKNSGIYGAFYCYDSYWNPLADDGDALRLAVKLDISLLGDFPQNIVVVAFDARRIIEKYDGDQYAATRRAIVRAAAAIGSAM